MTPRELIGTAKVPGGQELRLFRRGKDFMIVLDRNELMNSRMSGSEEALAVMTCERIGQRKKPHLLIGGYGMGFTLRAALAAVGSDARLTVVELVAEIIDWARGPMAEMTAGCLDDPRVALRIADVGEAIRSATGDYDAILLDVDNGPDGLVRRANDSLYSRSGLAAARTASASSAPRGGGRSASATRVSAGSRRRSLRLLDPALTTRIRATPTPATSSSRSPGRPRPRASCTPAPRCACPPSAGGRDRPSGRGPGRGR